MKTFIPFAAAAILAATPLSAQSASQGHAPVWHPSGKTPAAMYRPKARDACTAHRHHQSGKTMLPAASTACPDTGAEAQTASRQGSSRQGR